MADAARPTTPASTEQSVNVSAAVPRPSRWRAVWRFLRSPANAIGVVILGTMIGVALFAPQLAPYDPIVPQLSARLQPPVWDGGSAWHPLGTDDLGRDMLSRIIFGARISLVVGFVAAVGGSVVGTTLGLIAGYVGGWVDAALMRLVDVWMAFPFILLALATIAVLGAGVRNLIIVFVVTGWMTYARVTRAATLTVRSMEFVTAARASGAGSGRIIGRHLLPNLVAPIIVLTSFQIASLIMAEAALSFLGLGVRPPTPAWGSMMAAGRGLIQDAWWVSTLPGVALALTVLGVNLLGDGLRDALAAPID
jgi:peptide/nickel transport system permease protein